MNSPLLRVSNLKVGVKDGDGSLVPAVLDATLSANRGEIVGVVGESGSGKSLTLRSITGLLPIGVKQLDGTIELEGRNLAGLSEPELRQVRGKEIGMVFQEPMTALNPTMKIGEQIAESPRTHLGLSRKDAETRAVELLDRVGIDDPARCISLFPHQLSGGMRQRAMIAIAVSSNPALLLCDEPTTALDATAAVRVLALLGELRDEMNVGIIVVTHDLGVISRSCSRVVVMYAGSVVEEGPVEEVLQRPRHPYTLALLRSVPTRETTTSELLPIPGSPPLPGQRPPGCPFAPRCAIARPECLEPVELEKVGPQHHSRCWRNELLKV